METPQEQKFLENIYLKGSSSKLNNSWPKKLIN